MSFISKNLTSGDDVYVNTNHTDVTYIYGLGGDDWITGGVGSQGLFGNEGDDLLVGGLGNDLLDGGTGIDVASYSYSAVGVSVDLAAGTASAGLGDQDILNDIERVTGSSFADTLRGDAADNALWAKNGDDRLFGLGGNDWLHGGNGMDEVSGGLGDDVIFGGTGNDLLIGGAGADHIEGGIGFDTVSYIDSSVGVAVFLGAPGPGYNGFGDAQGDTLTGIERAIGSKHGDTLVGTSINDTLEGRSGNDALVGGGGGDSLYGGSGKDLLYGEKGNDMLNGGNGADRIEGGKGVDTASYAGSTVGVSIDLDAGAAHGGYAEGDELITIENLTGTKWNDFFAGNAGNNRLIGGAGADILAGRAGQDNLEGGTGNDLFNAGSGDDKLNGGAGADQLTGSSGADTFVYKSFAESGVTAATRDIITDFQHGVDKIDFDAMYEFPMPNLFIGTDAFNGHDGEIRFSFVGDNTIVSVDVDGNSTSDFEIQLNGHVNLTATDFIF